MSMCGADLTSHHDWARGPGRGSSWSWQTYEGAKMGLDVDIGRSSMTFSNPKDGTVFNPLRGLFYCVMHQFTAEFEFGFDPDPAKGVGGAPASRRLLQVGIVQNILYEQLTFEYSNGSKFTKEFLIPVLDTSAKHSLPFIYDPTFVPECMYDSSLSCTIMIPVMTPVRDLFYTAKGYEELLNPWDPSGVELRDPPTSVDMIDEPLFGAPTFLPGTKAVITKAERILAIQTWLIAMSSSDVFVVAHIGPFSLIFWLETEPAPGM